MFQSGEFTSEYVTQLDDSPVPDKQVQPHGVELTVNKVFKMRNFCIIGDDEYQNAERTEATLVEPGDYEERADAYDHARKHIVEVSETDEPESQIAQNRIDKIGFEVPHYVLLQGPYVVRYNEKIRVPDKCVGFVLPRSRLIRNNNYLSTAVWDSGYEGRGEGGLHINCMTFLEKGMRLGQFVLARASVMEQYDGSHQ